MPPEERLSLLSLAMSFTDDILIMLGRLPDGMTDAELAEATGKRHQQVNQYCRQMATEGLIVRGRDRDVIVNRLPEPHVPVPPRPAPTSARTAASTPAAARAWSWEGNVRAALCRWLTGEGWALIRVADTASRKRGTDVVAKRSGVRMHIEVKGFPSTPYADPRRAGEIKATAPSVQAEHWYADALLKALRLREEYPGDRVAMAFPDTPRYLHLLSETATSLMTMRIDVFLVCEDGSVRSW